MAVRTNAPRHRFTFRVRNLLGLVCAVAIVVSSFSSSTIHPERPNPQPQNPRAPKTPNTPKAPSRTRGPAKPWPHSAASSCLAHVGWWTSWRPLLGSVGSFCRFWFSLGVPGFGGFGDVRIPGFGGFRGFADFKFLPRDLGSFRVNPNFKRY